jgi:hypothetical protein
MTIEEMARRARKAGRTLGTLSGKTRESATRCDLRSNPVPPTPSSPQGVSRGGVRFNHAAFRSGRLETPPTKGELHR